MREVRRKEEDVSENELLGVTTTYIQVHRYIR